MPLSHLSMPRGFSSSPQKTHGKDTNNLNSSKVRVNSRLLFGALRKQSLNAVSGLHAVHLARQRPCSQNLLLLHLLQPWRRIRCSQTLPPWHFLQRVRLPPCSHFFFFFLLDIVSFQCFRFTPFASLLEKVSSRMIGAMRCVSLVVSVLRHLHQCRSGVSVGVPHNRPAG